MTFEEALKKGWGFGTEDFPHKVQQFWAGKGAISFYGDTLQEILDLIEIEEN